MSILKLGPFRGKNVVPIGASSIVLVTSKVIGSEILSTTQKVSFLPNRDGKGSYNLINK